MTASARQTSGAAWGWVLLAGLFEVGFTYTLKMSQQDDKYLGLFLLCAVISFECLSKALKTLGVGLAYAVWTGIGAVGSVVAGIGSVGTILLGLLLFGDSLSALRLGLLAVLVASIVGLKVLDR